MSYYHNYRRPRYNSRYYSHGRRGNISDFIFGFISIIIAFIVFNSIKFLSTINWSNVFAILIGWSFFLGIIYIIYRIIKKPKNFINSTFDNTLSSIKQIELINSEKHGCKCYMDGLTTGEQEIAHILSEGLSYKDYFIFNNLIIPTENGGSSQIDHLVVSKFGIFVIESKDYKGWIFGDKDQENWTQSLPGGNNKFQFQNPIRQNYSHIMALRKLINFINEKSFESIVVFTNSCEIKTEPIGNVVYENSLISYIQKFNQIVIPEDNLHLIIGKLSYICQTVDISSSQHVENLKLHHQDK